MLSENGGNGCPTSQRCGIAWQFTSRDARRKLERLYLVKEPASD